MNIFMIERVKRIFQASRLQLVINLFIIFQHKANLFKVGEYKQI